MPRLKLKSSQTFLAIKRCEGTKIGKVIKQSRSSKLTIALFLVIPSRSLSLLFLPKIRDAMTAEDDILFFVCRLDGE
jgi:hypothetical protein